MVYCLNLHWGLHINPSESVRISERAFAIVNRAWALREVGVGFRLFFDGKTKDGTGTFLDDHCSQSKNQCQLVLLGMGGDPVARGKVLDRILAKFCLAWAHGNRIMAKGQVNLFLRFAQPFRDKSIATPIDGFHIAFAARNFIQLGTQVTNMNPNGFHIIIGSITPYFF
jgi:hypothetical protein